MPVRRHGREPASVDGDASAPERGEVRADLVGEGPQDAEVEGEVGDLEARRQGLGPDHLRRVLVAAEHEPAVRVAHVHARLEQPHDRLERRDPGDRLGDVELVAHRHERERDPGRRRDGTRPAAGGVDDDRRDDVPRPRRHPRHARPVPPQPGHRCERREPGPQLGGATGEADRHARRIEPAVGGHVPDGPGGPGPEVRGQTLGFRRRHEARLYPEALGHREIRSEPSLARLRVRRLQAPRPMKVHRAASPPRSARRRGRPRGGARP